MSLFNANEISELLDSTLSQALDDGLSRPKADKLSRKVFLKWLNDYTVGLKEQIALVDALDPNTKDERVKKAFEDFHHFRLTYFPHYYTLMGKSELQKDLEATYKKIIAKKEFGLKFAKAAPRGFGKSTDVSIVFIIYCIVYDLKHFITLFSDAIELTETLIESIKAELEENIRLKADFSHATSKPKIWKIGEIVTSNNIKIKGYGSGKRVRGVKHGVYRPDLTIIDDLENDTNVRSRKQRDKLEDWLDDAVDNLGSVDGKMDILYIGTILHRDSVLSRKLKLKFWHPVIFRALISYPARLDLWEQYSKIYKHIGVEDARNFYLERKSLMDEGAKLLWDSVSLEYLMRKRAGNNSSFQKEQQNNPNSENQTFNSSSFKVITKTQMPKLDKTFLFVDSKGDSDSKGDFSAFVGGGISNTTQKLYIFLSFQAHIKGASLVAKTLEIQKLHKFNLIGGDKNGGFFLLRDWLKQKAWEKNITIKATKFTHHTQNKEDRLSTLEFPITDEDIVFVESSEYDHKELFEQMEDFPEALNDDLHDALEGVYSLSKLKRQKRRGNTADNGSKRTRYKKPRRNKRN